MTSAPSWASVIPASGTATKLEISMIRTPASGRVASEVTGSRYWLPAQGYRAPLADPSDELDGVPRGRAGEHQNGLQPGLDSGDHVGVHPVTDHHRALRVRFDAIHGAAE